MTNYYQTKHGSQIITIEDKNTSITVFVEGNIVLEYGDKIQVTGAVQKYKDEWIAHKLLYIASWVFPIFYRVEAEMYARVTQPSDDTINALQYSAIAFLVLGGASIVYLKFFPPRIPNEVVEAYNEDLRMYFDIRE